MKRLLLLMLILMVGGAAGMYSPWIEIDEMLMSDEEKQALALPVGCFSQQPASVIYVEHSLVASSMFVPKKNTELKRRVAAHNLVCDLCLSRFAHASVLKKHIKRHNANVTPFLCVYCDKAFEDKRQLIDHVATYHWFVCELCPRELFMVFHCRYTLAKHMHSLHE